MGGLKYSEFIEELLAAKGLKKTQLAKMVSERTGVRVTPEQIYDFFDADHEPRAGFAKAVELALDVNLSPKYYGWGDVIKPGGKRK